MKIKTFKDGSRATHRDHGPGVVRECTDEDYVYFRADEDGIEYFAYRGYLSSIKE